MRSFSNTVHVSPEVHLELGPSVVNDNDDLLVTLGDMTDQAQ